MGTKLWGRWDTSWRNCEVDEESEKKDFEESTQVDKDEKYDHENEELEETSSEQAFEELKEKKNK